VPLCDAKYQLLCYRSNRRCSNVAVRASQTILECVEFALQFPVRLAVLYALSDRDMKELRQALNDISTIRRQVALGTQFRGYGPLSIACSGILAVVVAAAQTRWVASSEHDVKLFLSIWISTAAVAVLLSALQTALRMRHAHDGLGLEMIKAAVEQFVPCVVAATLLTVVLVSVAPQQSWMLPGLWAIIFSLGIFASSRFLPRQMFAVGAWYLAAGLVSLVIAAGNHALLPWAMGISFGVGQLFVAAVLRFGFEDASEET
jgi:hypothetical protein